MDLKTSNYNVRKIFGSMVINWLLPRAMVMASKKKNHIHINTKSNKNKVPINKPNKHCISLYKGTKY